MAAEERPPPPPSSPSLSLVITNIQKRSNIRHLLLTAAAFGCTHVFVVGQAAFDFRNGSSGSSTNNPAQLKQALEQGVLSIHRFSNWTSCADYFRLHQILLVGVEIHPDAIPIHEFVVVPPTTKLAILMGNEGQGISPKQMACCDMFVRIPQYGVGTASLNVYVAASIVLQHCHQQLLQQQQTT